MSEGRVRRSKFLGSAGLLAGALVGAVTVVLAGTAVAHRLAPSPPQPFLEATHVPPLLTAPGERVELRYDAYCATAEEVAPDAPCNAAGSVFVRSGLSGSFSEIALREDRKAPEGRLWAAVPDSIARSSTGFTYYAVVRSLANGKTVTLPAGGAGAPQRSLPLPRAGVVTLPAHSFGRVEAADRRVVEAPWGSGPGEVGLEDGGPNVTPIGGSSFDVSTEGDVYVLDEANRRVLRWDAGAAVAKSVPLAINGTLADMSVSGDGAIHVLENAHAGEDRTLLATFGPTGNRVATTEVADRASQIRVGPLGPVVLQSTSGEWTSPVTAGGKAQSLAAQTLTGRSGRPLAGGREVVVLRTGGEIRLALLGPGSARRTWRVTSPTPLAEVQLAEPIGERLLVVARTYTDRASEFVVLVLGPKGLEQHFSLSSADWAETAPLSRFRLRGSSLYQLGSTPAGLFVDRFDLEVNR
jgi:hypothetical protein